MAQRQGSTAVADAPDTLPSDFFDKKQQSSQAPDTLPGDFFDKKQSADDGMYHGEEEAKPTSKDELPGATPRLRSAVEKGIAPMQAPTRFEKEHTPQDTGWLARLKQYGGDVGKMAVGMAGSFLTPLPSVNQISDLAGSYASRVMPNVGQEGLSGARSPAYAALATGAQLAGVDPTGMETSAEHGDPTGVLTHAAAQVTPLAAAELARIPAVQRTVGRIIPSGLADRFATPAVAPGLSDEATANLQEPLARRGVEKVLRSSGMPSGQANLRESFTIAAPDLAEIERAQPLGESGTKGGIIRPDMRLRQTVENIDNRLDKIWKEERQPQIDRNAELPALSREQLLGDATIDQLKRIEKAFKMDIPDQINLGDADKMLVKVNARLRRAEGMTPEARALALELSPDLQKFNEMKGELHQAIGGLLERVNEPGIKEFNRRYGALSEVRDALRNKMNPVEAERVLDSVRATGGLGRNVNLFERLHLKASPGRLAQKGLEDLSRSNLQITPPAERPPVAGLLPPPPEPLGNGPDVSGPTNLPVPEGHTVVPVPGGRFVRGLLPGPIAPEAPTPPPPVPPNFRIEPIGAPTEPGRVGMRGEQGTRVPQKGLLPELATAVPAAGKLAFKEPLNPLQNTKPIMEGAPELPKVEKPQATLIPKVGEEEATPAEIKGVTEPLKAKTGKAKPTPIEKRFTSEQIADAEGMLRAEAEAMQAAEVKSHGRQFVEDAPWESTTASGRNVKKGERMGGRWMNVGGGRDMYPFLRENPKVNPGDIVKALRNKDSAAYRNLVEKAVDFNRRNAPAPDEAYDFVRGLGANPDAELEGIQQDIGGAEPTFNPEEIEEQAKPEPEHPSIGLIRTIGAINEAKKGGILPGMEEHVAKQNEGAAKVAGENLTAEANKPKDITAAAGRMETMSPLFRGTEASPQREIFGNAPPAPATNAPPAAIQQAIEGTDWKFEGKNDLGLYTIQEPGTKIRISLFERDLHPDFIRRKIAEKEKQFGAPEKGKKQGEVNF